MKTVNAKFIESNARQFLQSVWKVKVPPKCEHFINPVG